MTQHALRTTASLVVGRPSALTIIGLIILLASNTTWAQPSSQPPPSPAQPWIETPNDVAYQIGQELRCPVCQGMPIAESPSQMAQDMMKRVRQMVKEGQSRDSIVDYFVGRYGEWVLLKPRARGFNIAVWILPPVGLLLGAWLVLRHLRRLSQLSQHNQSTAVASPKSSESSESPISPESSISPAPPDAPASQSSADPYVHAIRNEVDNRW